MLNVFLFREKLSELRREKQKLVEKIMDQYRVLEPSMQPPASKAKYINCPPVHSFVIRLKADKASHSMYCDWKRPEALNQQIY